MTRRPQDLRIVVALVLSLALASREAQNAGYRAGRASKPYRFRVLSGSPLD
jgi:hypothetical protein